MLEVAELFQRVFLKRANPPTESLVQYLRTLFLESPERDPDIQSQVYVRRDGAVAGFIGALALPMSLSDRPVRAAICSCLMVDRYAEDPLAGARLLRTFLSGPQDISLSETASDVSANMWSKLRGVALPAYSLEWVRLIKPTGFLVELLADRFPAARILSPLAWSVDAWNRRKSAGSSPRWSTVPVIAEAGPGQVNDIAIDNETLIELVPRFTSTYLLHPRWTSDSLRRILADAAKKARYGDITRRMVVSRGGAPIGAFIYHGRPGRVGYVLQILAAPGQTGPVVDCMIARAAASGLVALRGRTQPALLDAMLTRRCAFTHLSSTVVHARDRALIEPFLTGHAFFNGLAGEAWTRLIGDDWSADSETN